MEAAAILIAPHGTSGELRALVDRLLSVGIQVTIVDELSTAAEIYANHADPPCVLLDLGEVEREAGDQDDNLSDNHLATKSLRRVQASIPLAQPVPILAHGTPSLILACIRGGAGDVIDLRMEGTGSARAVVERVCRVQRERTTAAGLIGVQRQMIEDLLKDLIKTERRSIDVEEQLAAHARVSGEAAAVAESRGPSVLLVEHDRAVADELADRLEAEGVATFAYVTGEEAVREASTLSQTTGLDLALVAAQLPGIDGLETVRRLRERIAALPAFLMTSVLDADLAASAADLGVVGFVQKPLADLDEVVVRLAQLARESLERAREQAYVQRIKERHERVLERYRSLPREP